MQKVRLYFLKKLRPLVGLKFQCLLNSILDAISIFIQITSSLSIINNILVDYNFNHFQIFFYIKHFTIKKNSIFF